MGKKMFETRRTDGYNLVVGSSTGAVGLATDNTDTLKPHKMDDTELQAIRAARLQEMQRNAQGRSTGGSGASGDDGQNAQQEKANSYADSVLNQILEPEAKQRLNRVRMVKPERVLGVENYLIRLYQSGGIRGKVGEEDIVEILDKIANEERKSTTTRIKFERREYTENNNTAAKPKNSNHSDSDDDFFDE